MSKLIDWIRIVGNFPLLLLGTCGSLVLLGFNIWMNSGAGDLISVAKDIPKNAVMANYVIPTFCLLIYSINKLMYSKGGIDKDERNVLNTTLAVAVSLYGYFIYKYIQVVYVMSETIGNYVNIKNTSGQVILKMSTDAVEDSSIKIVLALLIDFAATGSAILAIRDNIGGTAVKATPPTHGATAPSTASSPSPAFYVFETAVIKDMSEAKTLMMNPASSKTALETKLSILKSKLIPPTGVTVDAAKWAQTKLDVTKMISELEVEIGKKS